MNDRLRPGEVDLRQPHRANPPRNPFTAPKRHGERRPIKVRCPCCGKTVFGR